jgi:hypothetical protein
LAQTANRARATSSAFTVAIDGGERLRDRTDRVRLFADKKNAARRHVCCIDCQSSWLLG